MTRIFINPTRRIALAIAISLLLHGLVLWLPHIKLLKHEVKLHSLSAKLIPLPKASGKIADHKHKPKTQQHEPVVQPEPEQPLAASEPVAASAPVAASEPVAASAPLAASEPVAAEPAASAPVATPDEPQRPALPKHAKLSFSIYHGPKGMKMGESVQTLEIDDGHYTLRADVHTTGLVKVFKSYHIEQTSTGTATEQTLKPATFAEEITDGNNKRTSRADFDWSNQKIHFSDGSEAPLPPETQDILSILYQFPPMRPQQEIVSINITTGKKFESFHFEIAFEEVIETGMGKLQTVHFRKQRAANEEGLEIWFAQEYRLLPVKVSHLDRDGKIDAEAIITDIQVSDE